MLAGLLRSSFAEFAGLFDPPSGALSETRESIQETLKTGAGFIVEVQGQAVGCVFSRREDGCCWLFRLGVLPNFRGKGIGVALVAAVEESARGGGFEKVRLGTRLAVPRNIAYYQALGYEHVEDGIHPETGLPFYAVMEKDLKNSDKIVLRR